MEIERRPQLAVGEGLPPGFDSATELLRSAMDQIELGEGPLTQRVLRAYTKFRPVKEEQLPIELRASFLTLFESFQRAGQIRGVEIAQRIIDLAEELQARQRAAGTLRV